MGKVRASVRSHGAQMSARTERQRGALPLAVVRDDTARGHAVKVAPCASCDRGPGASWSVFMRRRGGASTFARAPGCSGLHTTSLKQIAPARLRP